MIRNMEALREHLAAGNTVSLQGLYEGRGFRLATSDTNETVSRQALYALMRRDEVMPVQFDMAGDPCEWGIDRVIYD
jgi:hypothetical protein